MNLYLITIIGILIIATNLLWLIYGRLSALVRFNSAWLIYWEKDDYDIFTASRCILTSIEEMSGHVMIQTGLLEKIAERETELGGPRGDA